MFIYEVNIDLINAERGRKYHDTEECFSGGSSTNAFNNSPYESTNRKMRDEKKKKKSYRC